MVRVVRHEDYDRPSKLVKVREYLIKWAGQSYSASTWEAEALVSAL